MNFHVRLLQSCPTLWDPMDYCLPGSSVHGVLQARILEGVAMPSSRGSSRPRGQTCMSSVSCIVSLVLCHYCRLISFMLHDKWYRQSRDCMQVLII